MPETQTTPKPRPPGLPDEMLDTFRHLLLQDEYYPRLWNVFEVYWGDLLPDGGVQEFLLQDMVVNHWRIWRLQAMEAAILNRQIVLQGPQDTGFDCGDAVLACQSLTYSGILPLLSRLENQARRAYLAALLTIKKLQGRRVAEATPEPQRAPQPESQPEPAAAEFRTEEPVKGTSPCSPQPDSPPTP